MLFYGNSYYPIQLLPLLSSTHHLGWVLHLTAATFSSHCWGEPPLWIVDKNIDEVQDVFPLGEWCILVFKIREINIYGIITIDKKFKRNEKIKMTSNHFLNFLYMCVCSFSLVAPPPIQYTFEAGSLNLNAIALLNWKVFAVFLPCRTVSCIPGLYSGVRSGSSSLVRT